MCTLYSMGIRVRKTIYSGMFSRDLPLLSGRPVIPCPFSRIALPHSGKVADKVNTAPGSTSRISAYFRVSVFPAITGKKNCRRLFRSNRPVTVHQVAKSRMVIPSAIVPIRTAATLHSDNPFHRPAKVHRDSHPVLVMIDKQLPNRAPLPASGSIQSPIHQFCL